MVLEIVALLGPKRPRHPFQKHVGVAHDRGQRGAQLVAHRGQEVRLQGIDFLQAIEAALQLQILLLQRTVALLHRLQVHLVRQEHPVTGEDEHVDDGAKVGQHPVNGASSGARRMRSISSFAELGVNPGPMSNNVSGNSFRSSGTNGPSTARPR